ncbi:MAG: Nudix family hydrolase [Gammaproteobacteria bacterium]|nr:Nudix family hydrolase [Gammaproteobacteria bacterium]
MAALIPVAAAVVTRDDGRILIARRPDDAHQGGLWEFPGGKVEAGETARRALVRELAEELAITVTACRPQLRVRHAYADRSVLLDVWRVTEWRGEARGREGQAVAWVTPAQLADFAFPAANRPIVAAAHLPERCLVTPPPGDPEAFLAGLEQSLAAGVGLVQLRAGGLPEERLAALAEAVTALCHRYGALAVLNGPPDQALRWRMDGVHLTSPRLMALVERPAPAELWCSASCHTPREVARANDLGLDFILCSPVKPTASHPGAATLGWAGLHALTELAAMPVYALGGMVAADLPAAWNAGAQGIAAIGGLWQGGDAAGRRSPHA